MGAMVKELPHLGRASHVALASGVVSLQEYDALHKPGEVLAAHIADAWEPRADSSSSAASESGEQDSVSVSDDSSSASGVEIAEREDSQRMHTLQTGTAASPPAARVRVALAVYANGRVDVRAGHPPRWCTRLWAAGWRRRTALVSTASACWRFVSLPPWRLLGGQRH